MWKHHVETACGNIMWKHHVETNVETNVETACGNSLWKHIVETMWKQKQEKDIYDIILCLPEPNLTLQEQS